MRVPAQACSFTHLAHIRCQMHSQMVFWPIHRLHSCSLCMAFIGSCEPMKAISSAIIPCITGFKLQPSTGRLEVCRTHVCRHTSMGRPQVNTHRSLQQQKLQQHSLHQHVNDLSAGDNELLFMSAIHPISGADLTKMLDELYCSMQALECRHEADS